MKERASPFLDQGPLQARAAGRVTVLKPHVVTPALLNYSVHFQLGSVKANVPALI